MFAAEFWRPGFSFTRGRRLFLQTIIVLFSRKCILHITRPQGGRSWQFWPKKALFSPQVFQKATSATLLNILQHCAHWQKPGSTINFCRPIFFLSRYVHFWGELKGPETNNITLNRIFVRKNQVVDRGQICHCRWQCKYFASGEKIIRFYSFFCVFITKTVEISWNWRCKSFGLKFRRCKFFDKFHVCEGRAAPQGYPHLLDSW